MRRSNQNNGTASGHTCLDRQRPSPGAHLTPAYFVEELSQRPLLRPFDTAVAEGTAFWLVIPESRRNAQKTSRCRDWLMAEHAAGT
jgi:DNA-binding transcriptional LysR family regulator